VEHSVRDPPSSGSPANGPLGALVVWNDDEVAPGTGFELHSHANMGDRLVHPGRQPLAVGDGLAAVDEPRLTIAARETAELILVATG
jgi:hypothetical protein